MRHWRILSTAPTWLLVRIETVQRELKGMSLRAVGHDNGMDVGILWAYKVEAPNSVHRGSVVSMVAMIDSLTDPVQAILLQLADFIPVRTDAFEQDWRLDETTPEDFYAR